MNLDDGSQPPTGQEPRLPPRYVPTLTEVVAPAGGVAPAVSLPEPEPPAEVPVAPPVDDEERLLRVLQRVEVLLDHRLSAAVAQAADSVSREFAQRLRAELEPVIREAVSEAVAEELNPANHSPP